MFANVRYAIRVFAKSPAFTLVAVVTMALGIGANTAVFSLVNAVLLRSLPYGDAAHLVYFFTPNPRFKAPVPRELPPSYGDFLEVQRLNHSFSILTEFDTGSFKVSSPGETAQQMGGATVAGNFFETLEVQPELGRTIDVHDDQTGAAHVVVISDALWRSKFAADPGVLGKTLLLNGHPFQIVGVMPPRFLYPRESEIPHGPNFGDAHLWIPLVLTPQQIANHEDGGEGAIGRLRPGVSTKQAEADLAAIMASMDPLHRAEMRGWTAMVEPFLDAVVGEVRTLVWLLFGAVSVVLLIASTNVASLLMARATARAHEMGVRAALGAGRVRLIRQMLTESLILALGGGALGVALAFALVRLALRLNPGDIPRMEETSVDGRVLVFSLLVSLLTGVLFGLAPALDASRIELTKILKQGGGRGVAGSSNRLRHGLIVVEVALSVVLLAGAGLLIRSFLKVQSTDPGFSPSTLTLKILQGPQQRQDVYPRLIERISALPGVRAAGSGDIPLNHSESMTFTEVEGHPEERGKLTDERQATPRYFEAMNIRLLEGRTFTEAEQKNAAASIIVNEAFARHYFPGESALGKRLREGWVESNRTSPWMTIVGVIADIKHSGLDQAARPEIWKTMRAGDQFNLVVAANVPATALMPVIRGIVKEIDPLLTVADVHTMAERISESESRRRFQTLLLAIFAGVALFLALVGLYGLLAYSVKQRTAELGIRMTLGASRGQILAMVLRHGLLLSLAGVALGIGGAFAITRLISSWLYGVNAADPVTFIAAPAFLLLAAAVACLIPALRATRIDPAVALRYE